MTTDQSLTPSCQRAASGDSVRGCSVCGCPRPHRARGYCGAHYLRWSRHGDPDGGGPPRARTGPRYTHAHQRVRAARGSATAWPCAQCTAAAAVWSYDGADPDEQTEPGRGRRYSLDPNRYRPCCRSCHRLAVLHGPAVGALDVERAARLYRAGASSRGIAALLHVSRSTVLTALRAHGVPIRRPGRHR